MTVIDLRTQRLRLRLMAFLHPKLEAVDAFWGSHSRYTASIFNGNSLGCHQHSSWFFREVKTPHVRSEPRVKLADARSQAIGYTFDAKACWRFALHRHEGTHGRCKLHLQYHAACYLDARPGASVSCTGMGNPCDKMFDCMGSSCRTQLYEDSGISYISS